MLSTRQWSYMAWENVHLKESVHDSMWEQTDNRSFEVSDETHKFWGKEEYYK